MFVLATLSRARRGSLGDLTEACTATAEAAYRGMGRGVGTAMSSRMTVYVSPCDSAVLMTVTSPELQTLEKLTAMSQSCAEYISAATKVVEHEASRERTIGMVLAHHVGPGGPGSVLMSTRSTFYSPIDGSACLLERHEVLKRQGVHGSVVMAIMNKPFGQIVLANTYTSMNHYEDAMSTFMADADGAALLGLGHELAVPGTTEVGVWQLVASHGCCCVSR
jgi:hypothetical protein